jgi:hypothetical protein
MDTTTGRSAHADLRQVAAREAKQGVNELSVERPGSWAGPT